MYWLINSFSLPLVWQRNDILSGSTYFYRLGTVGEKLGEKSIFSNEIVYLCSVPRAVVPGDATSIYSDDTLDVDPTLHHMTAERKAHNIIIPAQHNVCHNKSCRLFTLALMMVGLGSKIPCIFLNAGMTKRLQVTTADTGLPDRESKNNR